MLDYLKGYIKLVLDAAANIGAGGSTTPHPIPTKVTDPISGLREVDKELDSLDARDFEPAYQTEFLLVRGNVAHRAKNPNSSYNAQVIQDALNPVLPVLDHYRGEDSHGKIRDFSFIADADLKSIIERDYAELRMRVYPSGAWKSSVVAAGSILEAILIDRLTAPKWNTAAMSSPKKGQGALHDWKLEKLIDTAQDIGLLPEDRAKTIHQVLRDYRNFVHPKKEIRAKYAVNEPEAMMSVGALDGVCNHLEMNP